MTDTVFLSTDFIGTDRSKSLWLHLNTQWPFTHLQALRKYLCKRKTGVGSLKLENLLSLVY